MRFRPGIGLLLWLILFAGVALALPDGTAHAYLDPGSGSFIIQVVIASVAGGLLALRIFWSRIAGIFRKTGSSEAENPGDSSENSSEG